MEHISVNVDGTQYEGDVEPRTLLVHWLREELGKVGTVVGCDTSNCGACTCAARWPQREVVQRSRHSGGRRRSNNHPGHLRR